MTVASVAGIDFGDSLLLQVCELVLWEGFLINHCIPI